MDDPSNEHAQSLFQEFAAIEENFKVVQESITNIKGMRETLLLKKQKPQKKLAHIGVTDLLDLPDELRKCVIAVMRSGDGTLDSVCERTKREVNLERGYLEALVAMNYLKKTKTSSSGQIVWTKPK